MKRRNFLTTLGAGTVVSPAVFWKPARAAALTDLFSSYRDTPADELATDESFWSGIRQAFYTSPGIIYLNNAGVCPQPGYVQEAEFRQTRAANEAPAHIMWHIMRPGKEEVRRQLAGLLGCDKEEIALLRNATEALEILLFGFDLKPGDEILTTDQDYPSMLNALKLLKNRWNIGLKMIKIPVPLEDESELVQRFETAISSNTRLILMCHMINLTGQVLPVRKVVEMAREKGVEVIIDGAHTFAHIDFKIGDLGCDYFGTSLHKWLCAPFGNGLLYIKKDKISKVWPIFGAPVEQMNEIRKFEHFGTYHVPVQLGISQAVEFHNNIGTSRKMARLQYLTDHWVNQVKDIEGIRFNTSFRQGRYGAIANVTIDGVNMQEMHRKLFNKYRLYTIVTDHEDVKGIRVSPNIYTAMHELDLLAEAFHELSAER